MGDIGVLKQLKAELAKKDAEDKLRRFQTQMSSKKLDDDTQLRPGIYDLLQTVESLTAQLKMPVTSNLPSDNGAQDVLIGQVLYDTTNFNTEAAEELVQSPPLGWQGVSKYTTQSRS